MTRTRQELLAHLDDQVAFLRASCAAYDQGQLREHKRIALALRILLHDTSQQRSLFTLLGVKAQLIFENTATKFIDGDQHTRTANLGLVVMRQGFESFDYLPKLHSVARRPDDNFIGVMISGMTFTSFDGMSVEEVEEFMARQRSAGPFPLSDHHGFEEWWTEPLMLGNNGDVLTRKLAVQHVANTDGGAHVDSVLKPIYERLSRHDTYGWKLTWSKDNEGPPHGSPFPATLRQIGQEVLQTVENNIHIIRGESGN